MFPISQTWYTAALRSKLGELTGAHTLNRPNKERLLPHFILPPRSAKDNEKRRPLTGDELVSVPVTRLAKYWTSRPCLLDAGRIKFDDVAEIDARMLSSLLTRATEFGVHAIPVVDLLTKQLRLGVVREYVHQTNSGLAIRLAAEDIDPQNIGKTLTRCRELLAQIETISSEAIIIIDFSNLDLSQAELVAAYLINGVHELYHLGELARVIFEGSNFPTKNPAQPNSSVRVARTEWDVWRIACEKERALLGLSSFGDFGADNGWIRGGGGGRGVIPHFRYATADFWFVSRGDTEFRSIRGVAKHILDSGLFMGEQYSSGDEFIFDCSAGIGGTGSATDWRRVNMNHHFTLVTNQVAAYRGLSIAAPNSRRKARQESLPL